MLVRVTVVMMMRIILTTKLALIEPILHAINSVNPFPQKPHKLLYFPHFANGKTKGSEVKHVA